MILKSTWNVPCLIKKMSGFQILAWCESALKWGALKNEILASWQRFGKGQPALLQMGKTRVLPSLVEQELNLIMLGKQRSLVWKSVFSGQLTKLDSSGLWRERRVIPIFTGIGRFTGGLSRLSYLNNLSYFFAFLVIPEQFIIFFPPLIPGAVQEVVQDL